MRLTEQGPQDGTLLKFIEFVYKESFVDIVRKHKDMLLFNFEVKGKCGHCDYNDYCRGCWGGIDCLN